MVIFKTVNLHVVLLFNLHRYIDIRYLNVNWLIKYIVTMAALPLHRYYIHNLPQGVHVCPEQIPFLSG